MSDSTTPERSPAESLSSNGVDAEKAQRLAELADLFGPEELDPELERYHYESENGWDVIKHPLVFSIVHSPHQNKQCNQQLAYKKRATKAALKEGHWHTYVFLHERPFRVDALKRIAKRMPDEAYWDLLSECWIDSENIRENPKVWQRLLQAKRPGREFMMDEDERDALANMSDPIEVFQGHTDERDDGWSWTLDRSKADWFARRFADFEHATPVTSYGICHPQDVIAFLTRRGESEILIPRNKVVICGVTPVKRPTTTSSGEGALVTYTGASHNVTTAYHFLTSTTTDPEGLL